MYYTLGFFVLLYAGTALVVVKRFGVRSVAAAIMLVAFLCCGVFLSGALFQGSSGEEFVVASTGTAYFIIPGGFERGALVYMDRTYAIDSFPAHLKGDTYIRTANDDKRSATRALMDIPLAGGATVYVAYAAKDSLRPEWLASFTRTGEVLRSDIERYVLYSRTILNDTVVVLGGNARPGDPDSVNESRASYFVIIHGDLRLPITAPYIRAHDPTNRWAEIEVGHCANPDSMRLAMQTALRDHAAWLAGDRRGIKGRLDRQGLTLDSLVIANAVISYADLVSTTLRHVRISSSNLAHTQLGASQLLEGCDLVCCDLTDVNLTGADLRNVRFSGSRLDNAVLTDVLLDSADFTGTDMANVVFEPKTLPDMRGLAHASHLEFMRYSHYPGALVELREKFDRAGYDDRKRDITSALERERTRRAGWAERMLRTAFFGFTCDFGRSIWKPLILLVQLIGIMFPIYLIFAILDPHAVLFESVEKNEAAPAAPETPEQDGVHRIIPRIGVFTLMSAFSIGRDEINLANWILRLFPRETRLRVRGTLRVLSGVHAIASFYLVILWVLLYLKNPFE